MRVPPIDTVNVGINCTECIDKLRVYW